MMKNIWKDNCARTMDRIQGNIFFPSLYKPDKAVIISDLLTVKGLAEQALIAPIFRQKQAVK
jgi:hypothetical protein